MPSNIKRLRELVTAAVAGLRPAWNAYVEAYQKDWDDSAEEELDTVDDWSGDDPEVEPGQMAAELKRLTAELQSAKTTLAEQTTAVIRVCEKITQQKLDPGFGFASALMVIDSQVGRLQNVASLVRDVLDKFPGEWHVDDCLRIEGGTLAVLSRTRSLKLGRLVDVQCSCGMTRLRWAQNSLRSPLGRSHDH
jgi:hypothetical protein